MMYITLLNQHIGTVKHLLWEAKAFDCSEFMRFGEKEQRIHQMNIGTLEGLTQRHTGQYVTRPLHTPLIETW